MRGVYAHSGRLLLLLLLLSILHLLLLVLLLGMHGRHLEGTTGRQLPTTG